MKHVELHNHTYYSILDGASSPEEYFKRAKELGMSHLAITDHGTTTGHRDFQREAKKAGIKPILGIEAYITDDRFDRRSTAKREVGTGIYNHITLLAKNAKGLENLELMNKIGWTEGFFHKPRIDIPTLEKYNEGIIALSGCMSGMVAKSLLQDKPVQAENYAKTFKEILGDRYFMEVMESNDIELNQQLMAMAKKFKIKPVITSDCHMASKEDRALAEAMLIINTNPNPRKLIDYPRAAVMNMFEAINYIYPLIVGKDKDGNNKERMSFSEFELWLHTYDEHIENLNRHGINGEPVDNTMLIADQIEDYPYYENLDTLPKVDVENEMVELRRLTYEGLAKRGMDKDKVNIDRVELELDTIEKKKLPGYFLIEKDFIDFAVRENILTGYGRGSAVSYLTNYALGITKINPMPYNLLPERFLSLDREDPADVDTDFAIDGRYKVKDYAVRKYHHVSNISTIGYYKDKSAIKAAAKVFKASFSETTRLTNKAGTIAEFEVHPDTADFRKKYPHLIPLAKKLNGRIQNFGMHAGGIILSKEPIENHVPLQSASDPSDEAAGRVPVAGLDMRELADMGYIKYDLLGLRTLSIVDDAIKMIKERHGVEIDIEDIPLDDKNLYDMISEGRTSGLFQAEASASTKTILDMGGTSNFSELVASNALVRPGAANSTVGETYINGKKTGFVKKMHPNIDEILLETYGAVLYQEQQLQVCEYIAGMTKADANKVRKAISKKIPEDLEIWEPEFVAGATKTIGSAKAKALWKDLMASADYAFAKAHAVGYSMLTLLTAYLKYYYPIEFLTCALNRMTGNKSDRMKFIKYMIEAKRMGIRIKLPHVNHSGPGIEIDTDAKGDFIRLGLSQIKGIGGKTTLPLIDNRPFKNYAELLELKEKKNSGVTIGVLGALNAIGGAEFEDNPRRGDERENLFKYLSIPSFETKDIEPYIFTQFRSLIDYTEDETFVVMGIVGGEKKKANWRMLDIVDDSGVASAFVDPDDDIAVGEVYVMLVANNTIVKYVTTEQLNDPDFESSLKHYLLAREFKMKEDQLKVIAFESRTTKAGKKMATVVVADEYKNMQAAMVWPSDYIKAYTKCRPGAAVSIGFGETDEGTLFVKGIR